MNECKGLDEQEKQTAKDIITILAKQMDRLTSLRTIMTDDGCKANQAYQMIEEAIYNISDVIGLSEEEMESLME